jgi:hypothetical protein
MDVLVLVLALCSGIANGTFPVFIKTQAVLRANVHPVVFQLYKSSCVSFFGLLFVAARAVRGAAPAWSFTAWASLSALAWIPGGVATIVAVPLIDMGPTVLTTSAVSTTLSFFVFWLDFGAPIKTHDVLGHSNVVLAPVYLAGLLLGMAGLVKAHYASAANVKAENEAALTEEPLVAGEGEESEEAGVSVGNSTEPFPSIAKDKINEAKRMVRETPVITG